MGSEVMLDAVLVEIGDVALVRVAVDGHVLEVPAHRSSRLRVAGVEFALGDRVRVCLYRNADGQLEARVVAQLPPLPDVVGTPATRLQAALGDVASVHGERR